MSTALTSTTKIIVADDHQLFIDGVCALLTAQHDFTIMGKATNGKEVLHLLNSDLPDLLIMDLNMPVLDGQATAERVIKLFPSVKILILSMYNTTTLVANLKAIGIKGYLPKDTESELLFAVIRMIAQGKTYFKPLIETPASFDEFSTTDAFLKRHNLTHRELEILRLISQNYSSQQIANKLFISLFTVDTHRKNMIQKLNVNKKIGLLKFALDNNLT